MLAGAVVCITTAVALVENREAAAEALLVIGAILIGSWIVLLTMAGHTGQAKVLPVEEEEEVEGDAPND
jgi:fatty acid desaturase